MTWEKESLRYRNERLEMREQLTNIPQVVGKENKYRTFVSLNYKKARDEAGCFGERLDSIRNNPYEKLFATRLELHVALRKTHLSGMLFAERERGEREEERERERERRERERERGERREREREKEREREREREERERGERRETERQIDKRERDSNIETEIHNREREISRERYLERERSI
ncbi:hypothetical protein DPMN_167674 [Dreissena polymorpha]|uniref:Uncharacterized protein n=1 Tax=Dreissena polymorpha TaxID=45954 RepID=A0A9D4F1U6_DREPO|nr:hypothetical protein DPMN_167674 [Dreissena polymorpha]